MTGRTEVNNMMLEKFGTRREKNKKKMVDPTEELMENLYHPYESPKHVQQRRKAPLPTFEATEKRKLRHINTNIREAENRATTGSSGKTPKTPLSDSSQTDDKLTPTTPDVSLGKVIGDYEIGHTLGKGAFSVVKYCVHKTTRQPFAVKIINMVEQGHMKRYLFREIAILKKLDHPHVVRLQAVFKSQNNLYIVMEYVTGGELLGKIEKHKRFSETTAKRYFSHLVLGLEYIHRSEIAHRDLKPQNLLLSSKDRLMITDFGLSTRYTMSDEPTLKTYCGTQAFMAPEITGYHLYHGFQADVWSIGVILYTMLIGKRPSLEYQLNGKPFKLQHHDRNANFSEYDKPQLPTSVHIPYPSFVSEEVKDLIAHILDVNPKTRFTIAQIKEHKWCAGIFNKRTAKIVDTESDDDNTTGYGSDGVTAKKRVVLSTPTRKRSHTISKPISRSAFTRKLALQVQPTRQSNSQQVHPYLAQLQKQLKTQPVDLNHTPPSTPPTTIPTIQSPAETPEEEETPPVNDVTTTSVEDEEESKGEDESTLAETLHYCIHNGAPKRTHIGKFLVSACALEHVHLSLGKPWYTGVKRYTDFLKNRATLKFTIAGDRSGKDLNVTFHCEHGEVFVFSKMVQSVISKLKDEGYVIE
mmetsp:Transcript_2/g.3  ORF Transcript_2/g.3 Transcript_2/m.3 type:complete len:638 (-) Transcript_2:1216-3129(-)